MFRTSLLFLAAVSCWIISAVAIQVTPNSPCSKQCADSPDLDLSDPNSSNTRGSDITCQDAKFGSSPAGIKWQNCMSCLQNSTFSQGAETDQMWFLYNMRFSLSYCVFNILNTTDIGDSPCITSFGCGMIGKALKSDVLSPQTVTPYGYCSADNSAMTHDGVFHCSSCVKATGETMYLNNYLVALDAGCQQKPEPGHVLGLNGSVFSPTAIGIVDPSTIDPSNPGSTKSSKHSGLSTAAIAGVVVAVIVLILVVAAILFIRRKKRENRRKRASYESKASTPWHITSNNMPTSPMSFQCATHMDGGPASPKFFPDGDDTKEGSPYAPDSTSFSSQPRAEHKTSLWNPHNAMSAFQNISSVTESEKSTRSHPLQYHPTNETHSVALHSLDTGTNAPLPSYPSQTHASPLSASITRFHSPQDYNTPTSATSVRSTAPLLPYNPAEYGRGPSGLSPVAGTGASPLIPGGAWSSPKERSVMNAGFNKGIGLGRKAKEDRGSPVESRTVGTSFPPPPPRR